MDELPRSVFCDEFTGDFSSLGAPVTTFSRDDWCQRTKPMFAGWTATHHAMLQPSDRGRRGSGDHLGPRPRRALGSPEVAAGGPNCWLVVGSYDNVALRTPEGWRLSTVKPTLTHQENEALLAAWWRVTG